MSDVCDRCGHQTEDRLDRDGDERLTRQIRRRDPEDGDVYEAAGMLWLCGSCTKLLDAFLAAEGTIEKKSVPVPVEIDKVPDYSCRPCRDGEHARCQHRVVFPDWSHDCECRGKVPHFRLADVLVTVLTPGQGG